MTAVKQITPFACGLACIESLAKDKGQNIDQVGLIARFAYLLVRSDGKCGVTTPYIFMRILTDLGLGAVFLIGYGRAFVESKKDRKDDGIFIFTEKDEVGQGDLAHAWRLENVLQDEFVVVEPSPGCPHPFMKYRWDLLEVRRCSVLVVEK